VRDIIEYFDSGKSIGLGSVRVANQAGFGCDTMEAVVECNA
jgi:hypothetical protein